MYLKRLVVHGFKSFADRTVMELEPGVTGIVGPNGCGKSNVADAIKWVLGEQSPKSLRATSMQDVLFEGADTRAPMSFCEVTLLFSDCEAQLGTAFNEVEVGRRVERDGGSDYFINGKACRLKDVQGLFRDTGIGRVAYSFLQQGQIDKLLSSNPMDRRAVFEEAAGISGFKARREETLRKLTETEGNLARLGDILTEVASSMNSLKRQAGRAIRAARLKRQVGAQDQALIAFDLQTLDGQIAQKSGEIAPLEETLGGQQAELGAKEETLKTAETQLAALITAQQELSGKIFENRSVREEALSHARFLNLRAEEALGRVAALEETLMSLTAQRLGAETELKALGAQLAEAKTLAQAAAKKSAEAAEAHEAAQKNYEAALAEEVTLREASTSADAELGALQAKLSALELESHGLTAQMGPLKSQREERAAEEARLAAEADAVRSQLAVAEENAGRLAAAEEVAEASRQTLQGQSQRQKENFDALQRAHAGLLAERNLLDEMQRRYEGFAEATQNLLATGDYTPLVEGLEVEPSATAAISALLSLELEAVCPKIPAAFPFAALHSGEKIAFAHLSSAPAGQLPAPEGFTHAADLIRTAPAAEFLKGRLEGCYICRDDSLFEKILREGSGFDFVAIASPTGAMLDGRGLFTAAGKPVSTSGFLTRSQRLNELAGLLGKSEETLLGAKGELTRLDHALADTTATLQKLRAEATGVQAQSANLKETLAKNAEAAARVRGQLGDLDRQTAGASERLEKLSTQRAAMSGELEALLSEKTRSDERVRMIADNLAALRDGRDRAYAGLAESRLAEANARHAQEVAEESERTLKGRLADFAARMESATAEASRLRADAADYQSQAAEKSAQAEAAAKTLEGLEAELAGLKASLDAQETSASAARNEREHLRERVGVLQDSLMRAKLEMGERQSRRGLLLEELQRRYGAEFQPASLNFRASLFEAEFFAKADEGSLEMGSVERPDEEELTARYPIFNREEVAASAQALREKLEAIGPINETALEDYKTQEARYTTLKTQLDDLQAAKTELTAALMDLNAQSSTLFATTFETIRANFGKTFESLFGGGKADLVLSDPNDALNSGIEIMARPPGTQLKTLGLLSGGQKTMTAVALLFAIYQVKPSPFCVLDELDAPLDDANIGRFLTMLRGFTAFSQFLMITHNKRTMASCNVLYGVTMQERGVSRIVSMRLSQAEGYSKPAPIEVEHEETASELAADVLNGKEVAETVLVAEANREAAITTEAPDVMDRAVAQAAEAVAGYSLGALKTKIAAALKDEKSDEAASDETKEPAMATAGLSEEEIKIREAVKGRS